MSTCASLWLLALAGADPCWKADVEIARAARISFLEPGLEGRRKATRSAIESLQRISAPDSPHPISECRNALENLVRFAATEDEQLRFELQKIFREESDLVTRMISAEPSKRMRAALEACSDPKQACSPAALEILTRDLERLPDARSWCPAQVAAIVHALRLMDRREDRESIDYLIFSTAKALRAMGFRRFLELISPRAFKLEPGQFPSFHDRKGRLHGVPDPWGHFPNEAVLFADEFFVSRGIVEDSDTGPTYEKVREWTPSLSAEYRSYLMQRWAETDEAAPHPDLNEVRREIERLERGESPRMQPTRSCLVPWPRKRVKSCWFEAEETP